VFQSLLDISQGCSIIFEQMRFIEQEEFAR